jgi:hypothetical protein
MRVAWTGARMIAIASAISLTASHGSLPGWAGAVWRFLLLGGMVNIIIAAAFEARRELALREERQRAAAALRMRRFPVGTCNVHGTVWAGPGAGSVFEALGDHRWCLLRQVPSRQLQVTPLEVDRDAVRWGITRQGGIICRDGRLAGYIRPREVSDDWVSPRDYYWWRGAELTEAVASDELRDVIRELPREEWDTGGGQVAEVVPLLSISPLVPVLRPQRLPEAGDPFPGATMSAIIASHAEALGEMVRRMSRKLAPGHMPECDCSECD